MQAQERADKEAREANAMQAQYETAWSTAEATHAQGRQLLDSLTKVTCRSTGVGYLTDEINWCPGLFYPDLLNRGGDPVSHGLLKERASMACRTADTADGSICYCARCQAAGFSDALPWSLATDVPAG